jgi:LPS-assembly lipoprotein
MARRPLFALDAAVALVLVLASTLAGCGWEPLYADPQSGPASAELRAIKVNPISDRVGQRLEIALRDALNPTGIPTPSRYTLRTTLWYSLSGLGLQSQGTSSLGQIDLHSTSYLIENRTGQNLLTISLHEQNSFQLNPNQYSTVVGEDDAQVRTVAELNQEIVRRLEIFLEQRVAEQPPKAG